MAEFNEETDPHAPDEERLRDELSREMRSLARRSRSIHETRLRLQERELDELLIEALIAALERYKFLDDERFAGEYARSKLRLGFGPGRIRMELLERGVAEALIEARLAAEELEMPERELLREQLAKRLRAKGEPRTAKDLKNLVDYLARRGFGFDLARAELAHFFQRILR